MKQAWTPGAERAFKSLVHLFPETPLRNYPDSVKTIIDKSTKASETAELLRDLIRCVNQELAASGNDWKSHPTMRRHNEIAEKAERFLGTFQAVQI